MDLIYSVYCYYNQSVMGCFFVHPLILQQRAGTTLLKVECLRCPDIITWSVVLAKNHFRCCMMYTWGVYCNWVVFFIKIFAPEVLLYWRVQRRNTLGVIIIGSTRSNGIGPLPRALCAHAWSARKWQWGYGRIWACRSPTAFSNGGSP